MSGMNDDSDYFDEYLDSIADEEREIEAERRAYRKRHRKRIGWFRYSIVKTHEHLMTKCSRVYGPHLLSMGKTDPPWWAKYLSRAEFALRKYIDRNPKKYRAW